MSDCIGLNEMSKYMPLNAKVSLFPSEFTDKQTAPLCASQYRLEKFTSFTSSETDPVKLLNEIASGLRNAILTLSSISEDPVKDPVEIRGDWFKVRAAYELLDEKGTLVVTLYTPFPSSTFTGHLVEFKRTSGGTEQFNTICWAVYSYLSSKEIISGFAFPLPKIIQDPSEVYLGPPLFPIEKNEEPPFTPPDASALVGFDRFFAFVCCQESDPIQFLKRISEILRNMTIPSESGQEEAVLVELRKLWHKIYFAYAGALDEFGTLCINMYMATPLSPGYILGFRHLTGSEDQFSSAVEKIVNILRSSGVVIEKWESPISLPKRTL